MSLGLLAILSCTSESLYPTFHTCEQQIEICIQFKETGPFSYKYYHNIPQVLGTINSKTPLKFLLKQKKKKDSKLIAEMLLHIINSRNALLQ